MMRLFLILFTFIIMISCDYNNQKFRKIINSDTLYLYDDDILRFKGPLISGMKNGKFYSFDNLGILKSISTYKNDTLNGAFKKYYASGIVKSDIYYIDGIKYGEELVFHDGFQDSIPILIDSVLYIAPYSTKLKSYNYLDMREKIMYQRNYNIDGKLTSKRGRLFLHKFHDTIVTIRNKSIEQTWLTPAPSAVRQLDVKQHFVVFGPTSKDTIFIHPGSLFTKWTKTLSDTGTYKFKAVAYLHEDINIETDTSNFVVIVKNNKER